MKDANSKYIVASEYLMMLHQGIYVIIIGAILPLMRESYGLSYDVSGVIVSAQNIGSVAGGLVAGFLALKWGIRMSNAAAGICMTVGFLIAYLTSSPVPLIIGFCLVGIGKGATSNYGNYLMNAVPGNTTVLLNAFHLCFAVGAAVSPLIVMAFTSKSQAGWINALLTVLIFSALVTVLISLQDLKKVAPMQDSRANRSLGFIKEYTFIMIVLIMFCYQAVECSFMGWMTSYYAETGIVTAASSQLFTSILWASVLAGRIVFTLISRKLRSRSIIKYLSVSVLVFLIVLLCSKNYAMLLIATIGMGLSISGMYANILASADDLFLRYALAMSVYFTIICVGGTVWPVIVGNVAEYADIHTGMMTVLVPAAAMVILCLVFDRKRTPETNI